MPVRGCRPPPLGACGGAGGEVARAARSQAPVTFGAVRFTREDGAALTLGEVPPVIFSETLRDADLTVSRAAFGEAGIQF